MLEYAIAQIKLLELLAIVAGAQLSEFDRQQNRVRSADGKWAKSPTPILTDGKLDPDKIEEQLKLLSADFERFDRLQGNTYKALEVKAENFETGFMTGFAQPDIFQALAFDLLKGSLGIDSRDVKTIAIEVQKDPARADEIVAKYAGKIKDNSKTNLGVSIARKYLEHKNSLQTCAEAGSKLLEKDFRVQLGCLNAFAMEVAMKAAPYAGAAIVPEILGAGATAGTLEAMLIRVAAKIPQNVTIGTAIGEAAKAVDRAGVPETATGLASGLLVAGAMREGVSALEKNPKAREAVADFYEKMQPSIARADLFASELDRAIERSGGDPPDWEKVYELLPQEQQQIFRQLVE